MGFLVRMLVVASVVFSGMTQATHAGVKLSKDEQDVFCGVEGHEPGPKYGQTVNAEVTWRIAAGARTPAEALGQMRTEYCLAKAAGEGK